MDTAFSYDNYRFKIRKIIHAILSNRKIAYDVTHFSPKKLADQNQ